MNHLIRVITLFCISPLIYSQGNTEWPWSQAIVQHTWSLGPYPKDRLPNLATVVIHDSEVYHPLEWGNWDKKDWVRVLTGTIGEKIQVGCRKMEGSLHEKASSITISGNLLDSSSNILTKLCPTTEWRCNKQDSLITCCRQQNVGNYSLDPSTNNVEITKSCMKEQGDCWHNFTLTKPVYVTCDWRSYQLTGGLSGLTFKFKIDVVARPLVMLVAVVTHADTDTFFTLNHKDEIMPSFTVIQGNNITIRCRLISESRIEPTNSYGIGPHSSILLCENQNLDCWLNLTAVQYSYEVMCGKNDTKYWGGLKIDVVVPTTQPIVVLNPKIFEIGPYVIRNTGLQQMLFNPAWSLKRVELSMQNNVSDIQPACSPFLKISYEGWTTWLQKRTLSMKRTRRDLTGVLGTGLGVLNSIDSEVIMNKLATSVSDLAKLQQPLRSSLLALGTNQWLLSNILPIWEKVNVRDHELITDAFGVIQNNLSLALSCIQAQLWMQSVAASIIREGEEGILPTEIQKIIWDSATEFEKELQSWWNLVNFTYDPVTNTATTFVLTIYNATIYSIYPIIALGLNHNGTILYPSEHIVWARKVDERWQTVNLESCIVQEQQGFICEGNTIEAQDICLDTEQHICHFEVHPNENPKTVLIYVGKGCVCLRTICDSLYIDEVVVEIKNHSNFCVCNFTKIVGCDFSYSTPVTSHQLLQSSYMLIHELLPVPIGMNLTLVKQLLQHEDLIEILDEIKENGQKTLITIHHDVKEIQRVFKRVQKDAEHRWWDTLFGWSPTATGILNKICHPIVVLLILVLISLTLSTILYVITWRMMNRLTRLKEQITRETSLNYMIAQAVARQQNK